MAYSPNEWGALKSKKDITLFIESSKTTEDIKTSLREELKRAEEIKELFRKNSYGSTNWRYTNICREYDEVKESIIDALKNDKNITLEELKTIKDELLDIHALSSGNIRSRDELLESLENKDINDYTEEEARIMLKYTQDLYKNYKTKGAWNILRYKGKLDSKYEIRDIQDRLIRKIFGSNAWFSNKYIQGFNINEKWWNYIIKIEDFQKEIQDRHPKDLNSTALWNFLFYLQKTGQLNEQNLINIFGEEKLVQLWDIWENHKKWYSLKARKSLKRNGLSYVIDTIRLFKSKSIEEYKKNIQKLDDIWLQKVIEKLKERSSKERKQIENLLLESLSDKKESKEEKEKIVNDFIEELINSPKQVKEKILQFETIYQVKLDNKARKQIEDSIKNIQNNKEKLRLLEEAYREQKKANEESKDTKTPTKETTEKTPLIINTSNGKAIQWNNGEIIHVNLKEANIIQNNPEAKENLIQFYDFFKEINMLGVWKYRKEMVSALNNININLTDNSLTKPELINLANYIIKFINNIQENKEKLYESSTLSWVKSELKKYSQADSIINDEKTFNIHGDDKFTTDLKNLGIVDDIHGFQKETFKQYLT